MLRQVSQGIIIMFGLLAAGPLVAGQPLIGSSVDLYRSPVIAAMDQQVMANRWSFDNTEPNLSGNDEFANQGSKRTERQFSVFKAGAYSLLVPGGGQYYLGQRRAARFFFATEVLTWIGQQAYHINGNWRKDDFVQYAADHANAQLEGKSEEFLDMVGFYDDIREYNSYGRAWDPERPYYHDTPLYHWEWQTDEERNTFRGLRSRAKEAYRRADFMIGIAVIDRIVSSIVAVRSAIKANRRGGRGGFSDNQPPRLELSLTPFDEQAQIRLAYRPGF